MPINKEVDLSLTPLSRDSLTYKSKYSHKNEKATPGYYQVFLEDHNVNVELTTALRTAYHKYTFAKDDKQSVVIDLGFAINWDKVLESSITIEDEYTIIGFRNSKGWARNQKVFFVAKFSKPISSHNIFTDRNRIENKYSQGEKVSAQLFFDDSSTNELFAKVALSSVSIENAKDNLDSGDFNFETIKTEAQTDSNFCHK